MKTEIKVIAGGKGTGPYRRGNVLTSITDVEVGQLLVVDSKTYKATNLAKVTQTFSDKFYAVFANPESPAEKRQSSDEEFVVHSHDLDKGEYFVALEPAPGVSQPDVKNPEEAKADVSQPESESGEKAKVNMPSKDEAIADAENKPEPKARDEAKEASKIASVGFGFENHIESIEDLDGDIAMVEKEGLQKNVAFITVDGGRLCYDAVKKEYALVKEATQESLTGVDESSVNQWAVIGMDVNDGRDQEDWVCDHLGTKIEPRQAKEASKKVGAIPEAEFVSGIKQKLANTPFVKAFYNGDIEQAIKEFSASDIFGTVELLIENKTIKDVIDELSWELPAIENDKNYDTSFATISKEYEIVDELIVAVMDISYLAEYLSNPKENANLLDHFSYEQSESMKEMEEAGQQVIPGLERGKASKEVVARGEQIWVRMGDNDDYAPFDSITDVVELLGEMHASGPIRWRDLGFELPGFEGQNYISCYHGDYDAQYPVELSKEEKRVLEEALGSTDEPAKEASKTASIEDDIPYEEFKNAIGGKEPELYYKGLYNEFLAFAKSQPKEFYTNSSELFEAWMESVALDVLASVDLGILASKEVVASDETKLLDDLSTKIRDFTTQTPVADMTEEQFEELKKMQEQRKVLMDATYEVKGLAPKASKEVIAFGEEPASALEAPDKNPITKSDPDETNSYGRYSQTTPEGPEPESQDIVVVTLADGSTQKIPFDSGTEDEDVDAYLLDTANKDLQGWKSWKWETLNAIHNRPEELEFEAVEGEKNEDFYADGPSDEDIFIDETGCTAYYLGKEIAEISQEKYSELGTDALAPLIKEWMDKKKYWPNIWQEKERGDTTLLVIKKKGSVESYEEGTEREVPFNMALGSHGFLTELMASVETIKEAGNTGEVSDDGLLNEPPAESNFTGVNEHDKFDRTEASLVVDELLSAKACSLIDLAGFMGVLADVYGIAKEASKEFEEPWYNSDSKALISAIQKNLK